MIIFIMDLLSVWWLYFSWIHTIVETYVCLKSHSKEKQQNAQIPFEMLKK